MYDFYQGGVVFHLDANGGGLIASPGDQINPTQNFAQHGYGIYYFDWGCKGTSIATGDQPVLPIKDAPTASNVQLYRNILWYSFCIRAVELGRAVTDRRR